MTRKLLNLNGIAVLGVVLNHAVAWGYVAMFWWAHRYRAVVSPNFDGMASSTYYTLRAVEELIAFAIPAFLVVSGYFISFAAGRQQKTIGWEFILPRVRNLAVPYLLWSVIMLGAGVLEGDTLSPVRFMRALLLGQATPAFYFVPLIIQLYLGSKLLLRIVQWNWKVGLAVAGALQILVHLVRYWLILSPGLDQVALLRTLTAGWFFPGNSFWFVFGIVLGLKKSVIERIVSLRSIWIVSATVFFILGILEWELLLKASGEVWITPQETLVDNLYSLAILLAWLSSGVGFPRIQKWLHYLGIRSYGIYLVHSLVLIAMARAVYHVFPSLLSVVWLFVFSLVAAGLGLPLLAMALVRSTPLRRGYSYLFG